MKPYLLPILGLAIGAQAAAAQTPAPPVTYTSFPDDKAKLAFSEPPAPIGTVAYNEWLGRMFNGILFNERSPDKEKAIADRIVHVDYVQHNRLVGGGRKGLLDFMPYVFKAMPDTRFVLHDVVATKDRVITRWTWTGTLTGQGFLGVEPKGQRVEFDGIDIWSVRDGQLYEHWDEFDWPRVFVELGMTDLPKPFYDVAAQPYSR